MSIFPHGRQPTTEIRTLGSVDDDAIAVARSALRETYGLSATVLEGPSLERFETDDRGQYDASSFLDPLLEATDADLVLGLTGADITMRRREYVFGVAYVGEPAAVVSTHRLETNDGRFYERLSRQVVKQAARTFGLEATHGDCVLERSAVVADLDRTSKTLCAACRERLTDPASAPRPPNWVVGEGGWPGDGASRTEDGQESGSGLPSITPLEVLLLPFVLVTFALAPFAIALSRLLAWEARLPADVRRVVHGTYRIVRFWTVVLAFFALTIAALVVQFGLYGRLVGGEPGVRLVWVMLVVAAIVGYVLQLLCRAFLGGVYAEFADV